ncbi:MAG TPA: pyridoxal phosphate-dependent aminotransferase [Acidobacteriota bacterium]|nr:pyridoxal phosphate-dependent aminotransferase [Acidobacteriota bacterium]
MAIKRILIDKANRLYQMPPHILAFVQSEKKRKLIKRPELIDLASFTWPVPYESDSIPDPDDLRPASRERLNNLKEELAAWMTSCHRVRLSPEPEIFIGGSVTWLTHCLAQAYINYGDIAFVPDPAVPLYRQAVTASGGEPIGYTMAEAGGWLPSFDRVQTHLGRVARLLFLNSPHNPTGAVLGEKELADLVWIAARENIPVINDAAYQGISDRVPTSLLAVDGGKKVGVEVYSFAYRFGLPPIPFGFAAGNREIIRGLKAAAGLVPPHIPDYYVTWALRAIRQFPSGSLKTCRSELHRALADSAKLLDQLSLEGCGFDTVPFIWTRVERRSSAVTAARILYRRYRILAAPGTGFGENGQGYLRFSLTAGRKAYLDAAARVRRRTKLLHPREPEL